MRRSQSLRLSPNGILSMMCCAAIVATTTSVAAADDAQWLRVRSLAPGAKVLVTVEGAAPRERHIVDVDERALTIVNLANPLLPKSAVDELQRAAAQHPEYFSAALQGGTVILAKGLRLQRDGVFINDQQVATLAQIVERIEQQNVLEIARLRRGRGFWGHIGPLGGYFIGGMSGGIVGGLVCQASAGRGSCDNGAVLIGTLVGGIVGAGYGFRAARHETEEVIYRAPTAQPIAPIETTIGEDLRAASFNRQLTSR